MFGSLRPPIAIWSKAWRKRNFVKIFSFGSMWFRSLCLLCASAGKMSPVWQKNSCGVLPGSMVPLPELEKQHILAVLEHCKGNRTHAAKLLAVSIRTLRNKLHEYHGTQPEAISTESEVVESKLK